MVYITCKSAMTDPETTCDSSIVVSEQQNEATDFQFLNVLFVLPVRDDTGIRPMEEFLELEAKGLEQQPAQTHSQAGVGKLQALNELQLAYIHINAQPSRVAEFCESQTEW